MHAMLETIRIEAEALDAARTLIREKVVSRVAAAPGFVRGFWLEPLDGKALSILCLRNRRAGARPSATERILSIRWHGDRARRSGIADSRRASAKRRVTAGQLQDPLERGAARRPLP